MKTYTNPSRFSLYSRSLAAAGVMALVASCAPNAGQLQKTLEANPEILFNVIEKNPDKFMAVVQKAARNAEQKEQENAQKEEQARMEREAAHPLTPELPADRAFEGPANAPVTIVAYSDFQCPFCSRGFQTMEKVLTTYKGKIRYIHKHLPLPMHPLAMPAAKRFEAIALQSADKAYKFHDTIFEHQDKLNQGGEKYLDSVAKSVGADMTKLKTDMDGDTVKSRIEKDMAEAEKYGISGTPGYVVSGVSVRGAYPFQTFKEIIDKKLASSK